MSQTDDRQTDRFANERPERDVVMFE